MFLEHLNTGIIQESSLCGVILIYFVSGFEALEYVMTRSISPKMARVLERLELDRPTLITTEYLANILADEKIGTGVRVVAARLREQGWLLATSQRGVWEFVPAEMAGPYSRNDPAMPLQAFLIQYPASGCALTFQAGAWALGLADRVPLTLEIAVPDSKTTQKLPDSLMPSVFEPVLPTVLINEIPVLAAESILINMAAKPSDLRSWASATEWLPELASALLWENLNKELTSRTAATKARTGYLLQSLRPDLAEIIYATFPPQTKTWFGPRGKLRRHNNRWLVADTLLPFDPAELKSAL